MNADVDTPPPAPAVDTTPFKVYRPPSSSSSAAPPPLPDSYFTPTAADLQRAQAGLAARTQALQNRPLVMRGVREEEERKRHERYPETTLRIRFPDRTQLERVFPSAAKIRAVYAFVRGVLREDVREQGGKFLLYQPPKRELRVSDPAVRDLSLAQLDLAPSSVLLVRWLDVGLGEGWNAPAPLAPHVLAQAVDLPPPPVFDDSPSANKSASASSSSGASKQGAGAALEKKIPKWLKMGPSAFSLSFSLLPLSSFRLSPRPFLILSVLLLTCLSLAEK
ncbi:hypothetical protein C8J57DRAFT_1083585 [Mycena rebaudengoi]|nr:hypothetical protein C8J57DRAFT_1083585 [Mycena rebaudengoi]